MRARQKLRRLRMLNLEKSAPSEEKPKEEPKQETEFPAGMTRDRFHTDDELEIELMIQQGQAKAAMTRAAQENEDTSLEEAELEAEEDLAEEVDDEIAEETEETAPEPAESGPEESEEAE